MRPHVLLMALGAVACAQDSSFTALKDPEPPVGDTGAPPLEETPPEPPPPECPDAGLVSAAPVERDPLCALEPNVGPLDLMVEWRSSSGGGLGEDAYGYILHQPSMGDLTGDGTPDIALVAASYSDRGYDDGILRLLSGDGDGAGGPRIHWEVQDLSTIDDGLSIAPSFGTAMGDVDADGEPEVIVGAWYGLDGTERRIVALSADGAVEWVSPRFEASTFGQANLYDLDQDGQPEVYAFGRVFDGSTGALLWGEDTLPGGQAIVIDLDGDGTHELVTTTGIWNADRTLRCSYGFVAVDLAVADFDSDGDGDVLAASGTAALAGTARLNDRCAIEEFHYGIISSSVVADFDADGRPELGSRAYSTGITVRTVDDESLWSRETLVPEFWHTAFDFDADGFLDLVTGREALTVFDGFSGSYRWTQGGTVRGYAGGAVVLDIDGDGQAEVVRPSHLSIEVLGDRVERWPAGLSSWNQYTFHRSNIDDDLRIPTYNGGNWPEFNDFRSTATRPGLGSGAGQVDATIDLVNICQIECDRDTVQLTVRVANEGLRDAPEGIGLGVYSVEESGDRTVLAVAEPGEMIRSGFTGTSHTFTLSMADLPTNSLVLVADDNGEGRGRITECSEDNNELLLEEICLGTD